MMVDAVSKQYAQAIFDLMNEDDEKQNTCFSMLSIIVESIGKEPSFEKILGHPKVSKQEKKEIIRQVFLGRIDSTVLSFLFVLIDNDRFSLLEDIVEAYKDILDDKNKTTTVHAFSKISLTEDEKRRLEENLRTKLDTHVVIQNIIDESIQGGVRLEYEGFVLDDTLSSKLKRLKDVLKSK